MPVTTSAGRLFDAVASLIGLRQIVNYEGQAAIELEFLIQSVKSEECYLFGIDKASKVTIVDWRSIFEGILTDMKNQISQSIISAKFHNTLVEIIVAVATKIKQNRVVLSGGCFQNKYLTEQTVKRLREEGFRPYWHQRIPPNDGGIALGQAYAALHMHWKEPGKVIEIDATVSPIMGKVSFGGIKKEVCLELVPEVQIGNYVIVHVGFAISMMDEEEAQETLKLIDQMNDLENK
jgi:hydrogenase assembly chaperone HypC/HupF